MVGLNLFAVASGLLGASVTVVGKLVGKSLLNSYDDFSLVMHEAIHGVCFGFSSCERLGNALVSPNSLMAARAGLSGLVLLLNVFMWYSFTRALQVEHQTSAAVSIVSSVTNFLTTAMLGVLLFNDTLTPTWWVGAFLIILGTVLLRKSPENSKIKQS